MKISTGQMADMGSQLKTGAQALIEQTTRFQAQVNGALNQGWVAPSGSQFGTAYQEWDVNATHMIENLEQMGLVATNASENFEAADQASMVKGK